MAVFAVWDCMTNPLCVCALQIESIHAVQWAPFSAASPALLRTEWLQEELPLVLPALTRPSPVIGAGFRMFVHMANSRLSPSAAWAAISALDHTSLRSAAWPYHPKAYGLYFAATAGLPSAASPPPPPSPSPLPPAPLTRIQVLAFAHCF